MIATGTLIAQIINVLTASGALVLRSISDSIVLSAKGIFHHLALLLKQAQHETIDRRFHLNIQQHFPYKPCKDLVAL